MRKLLSLTALLLLAPAASWATPDRSSAGTIGDARAGMQGAAPRLYWDNGTRIEFPDGGFTLQINTLLQPRYTYTDASDKSDERNSSSFDMRRARLYVSGTALHNEFSYMLEGEFSNFEDGGERRPRLLDAYIDWNACDWGGLRMGQFKPAVSRSWNTHAAHLQFLERSFISNGSDFGRQQGLGGRAELGGVELGAAIFNGSLGDDGANVSNGDTRHLFVVNARFNAMGEMNPYAEGDIDWTEDMALNFGAAYAHHKARAEGTGDDIKRDAVSADVNLKSNGLSLHGEFFWNKLDANGFKSKPLGFYAQAGYFLVPRTIELAARYAFGDVDRGTLKGLGVVADDVNQVSVALNYYWWKHNLKAQLGYDYLNVDQASSVGGEDINTNRWMLQLSSYF
jgi:hypothetical protein